MMQPLARTTALFLTLVAAMACSVSSEFRAPNLNQSTLSLSHATLFADGASQAVVTVTALWADGTPLVGASVQLTAPGAAVAQPTRMTDANGTATGTLASTQTGKVVVSAVLSTAEFTANVPHTATLEFLAPITTVTYPPTTALTVTALRNTTQAGLATSLTITAYDATGARATHYAATLLASSSDANATLPGAIPFTLADAGQITLPDAVTFRTAGPQAITITDTLNAALTTSSPNITVFSGAAAQLSVSGPDQVVAGANTIFNATLLDTFGNVAISYDGTLSVASTSPQQTLSAPHSFSPGDAGTYAFSVALGTSGAQSVTVTDANALHVTLPVAVQAGPAVVFNLSQLPATLIAGDVTDVYVTAHDANANIATHYAGTLAFSSTDALATLPANATMPAGAKIFNHGVALRTAGLQSVTVIDAGNANLTSSASAQVSAAGFSQARVIASPNAQLADGNSIVNLTVRSQDAYGNAVGNQNFVLTASEGSDLLAPLSGQTDTHGLSSATLASFVPGLQRVTASFAGVSSAISVTFTTTACSSLAFAPHTEFTTDANPLQVALGDFDGDGKPDVASAHYTGAHSLNISFNQGGGVFGSFIPYLANSGSSMVAVADIDNDGYKDIVITDIGGFEISVYINLGTGGFGPQTVHVAGSLPAGVALADLNNDGNIDAAVACEDNHGGDHVTVFLSQGQGTFLGLSYHSDGTQPQNIVAGDLNNDGLVDLVTGGVAGPTVSVLMNAGRGSFAPSTIYQVGVGPNHVALGDVDGNGSLDVIASNLGDDTVSVLLNFNAGILATQNTYGTGSQPYGVTTADVNGDGRVDIVVANSNSDTISVLVNQNLNSFAARRDFTVGSGPTGLAVGDVTADGRADIIVANANEQTFSVLVNTCN